MAISLGSHHTLTAQANANSPYEEAIDLGDSTTAIVACVTIYDTSDTDGVVSGIKFGGSAMTQSAISYEADSAGHLSIWYLNSPSVSSTVIDISFGGTVTDLMGSVTEIIGAEIEEDSTPATSSSGNGSPAISWTPSSTNVLVFGCALSDQSVGSKITCDSTGSIYVEDVGSDTVVAACAIGSTIISWSDSDNDEDWTANGAAYKESTVSQVNKDLDVQYDMRELVNKDLDVQYDMRELIYDDLNVQYDILSSVNKDLDVQYDMRELVNKDLDIQYDMRELVNKDLDTQYDVRNLVNKDLQTKWDIQSIAAATVDIGVRMIKRLMIRF